jgi:rfaE bifunctional protein nucleotidyltransferase chain/domain
MDRRLGQVVSQSELISRRGGWKHNGQVVVCAVGRFDLLHPGHVRLLEQARALGDVLVVGINSDASSNAARPATAPAERAEILAALKCVDCTVVLDGSTDQFLKILAPEILVEGGAPDTPGATLPSCLHLVAPGCKLVRIPLEPGFSTATLMERIRQART